MLSPGFKSLLIKRKVPPGKIDVIYNWSNITDSKKSCSISIRKKDKFHIIFAGNIGKAQSIETIIDAAKILTNKSNDVEFIIIGDGIELKNIKNKVIQKNLDNVTFLPRVPLDEISFLLKSGRFIVDSSKKRQTF